MVFKLTQSRASRTFPAGLGLCLFVGTQCFPAAAQWSSYDGYQTVPPRAYYYAPAYQPYPDYPDETVPPPAYRRAPPYRPQGVDPYADPYGRQSGLQSSGEPTDLNIDQSQRTATVVQNPTREGPGTIIVDTRTRHLYLVESNGSAIQYGIGVGRQGFEWKGVARVARKAEWPDWYPPSDMLKRRPDLPEHMEGGVENPLGARALYLYKGNKDTLFRIHGTNEPDTIGKAVSSGCIRMMNADVIDLFNRVSVGAKVVVL